MSKQSPDKTGDKPLKCPCCLSEHDVFFLCRAGKDEKYPQYQCYRCGFQFSWPCPTEEEISRFYASEEYYAQTGDDPAGDPGNYTNYDEQIRYTLDFFRNWLKSLAPQEKSAMLDVGCALGRFMELARKEFGLDCSGVELSDYARNYVTEYYNGSFPVWKTVDEIPIPEKPFDLILLFDVIEHVNDPWTLLLGLFRRGCVGENTRVLITTPNCTYKKALDHPETWVYRYPPAHLSFCSPETLHKIMGTLLFRNIDISGHTPSMEGTSFKESLKETYSCYDGLACCFSGSSLHKIPPERIPATLDELQKLPAYLALLADYVFEKQEQLFNSNFRAYLEDFYNELVSKNECEKVHNKELSEKTVRLENKYNELAEKHLALGKDWNDQKARYDALAASHAALEKEWKAQVEHNSDLSGKYADLEKELTAENVRYGALSEEYAALRKEYQDNLAANHALISEMGTVNKNSYAQWLKLLELTSQSEQMIAQNAQLEKQRDELTGSKERFEARVNELTDYNGKLEARVNELTDYNGKLEKQVHELFDYNGKLEKQVHELFDYNASLENQVNELAGQKAGLENQVRELAGQKAGLENQVCELSVKLNEVYHSNSFRIGRMITWPVRKCKAAAAVIRAKLNQKNIQ